MRELGLVMGHSPWRKHYSVLDILTSSAFIGTNSRIHLKWNSGFDPSFGVLRRSDLRLAIIRTLSDGRDVTQLGPEVFSGTSISQGAQYLGDGHGQFALSGGPRIAQRGGPVEPVLLLDKEDFDDSNTK